MNPPAQALQPETPAVGNAAWSMPADGLVVRRPRSSGKGRVIAVLAVVVLLFAGAAIGLAVYLSSAGNVPRDQEPAVRKGNRTQKKPAETKPLFELPPGWEGKVSKAVARGKAFLRGKQGEEGCWEFLGKSQYTGRHQVGLAALPGLTLLTCGVLAKDPGIQKAATFVRQNCAGLTTTYDISLAILFLDRLNDAADQDLIRDLALRLVAGQTKNGGWSYHCPLLVKKEQAQLATALEALPAVSKADLMETPRQPDPYNKLVLNTPPAPGDDHGEASKLILSSPRPRGQKIEDLPSRLKKLPVLDQRPPAPGKAEPVKSDNSNTQFATLALWVARRHGVRLEPTLALVVKRFRTSQFSTGGWAYWYTYMVGVKNSWVGTPTMTCAGLLGLAVGHGLGSDNKLEGAGAGSDPAVERALLALGTGIGQKPGWDRRRQLATFNLYLLWSVERVGTLYRREQIGKVDWYAWGVSVLLEHQNPDGSWCGYGYTGSDKTTDTCLALLFLERVNLARDLTQKLKFEPAGD
jgi:hypothetical protein